MDETGSGKFTCNICGTECRQAPENLARETENCPECGSTTRVRAMIALLSREIFGVLLALPEFPVLKGIRGIGMSDAPGLADRLAEKFDYTNTFYHRAPRFDVTNPEERDFGRYDFILSSEVMEHVPPPVERAFAALCRMLKPDGFLLLTTPYNLEGKTVEHFPALHEYTLAAPGGRTVLVNRREDGSLEVFENLVFHGGHGSTLEIRCFTEDSLRATLVEAGFPETYFAAENWPEFGVNHAESWSLPIAARKGRFQPPAAELAREYREACRHRERARKDLAAITAEYERHTAFHAMMQSQMEAEMQDRMKWVAKVEAEWEDRTRWALELEQEKTRAIAEHARVEASEQEAWRGVAALEQRLKHAQVEIERLQAKLWTRIGRKLGTLTKE